MSEGEAREPDSLDGIDPPEARPDVTGHSEALATLDRRIAEGRLPGGVLLHGPRGIGKATLAFAVARRALTATGDEEAAHVAAQVTAGAHPNLTVLRRAARDSGRGFYTEIRVDEVRGLVERLHRTRGRTGHRLAVVDSIDDCNASSANALLKVLEEPPADTTFLLVSHRPGSLLPTIRSRCHALALRPLADDHVGTVLFAQRADTPADTLARAVALAEGRPRRGFEALLIGDGGTLAALDAWLAEPLAPRPAAHLALADAIAAERDGALARFGRDKLLDWMAAEARAAAAAGPEARRRLASAGALWEKATAQFAEADEYNLDARQTLVAVFDAIRAHVQTHAATTPA